MGLRGRIRRLQKRAEGPVVAILQQDGTARKFPEREFEGAFQNAFARSLGRTDEEHPFCAAARNLSDPAWRNSFYVAEPPEFEVEDLSEQRSL